jgi:sulfate permease, SulP family
MGQGVANIVAGFFRGMGGCAMIGRTMINVKSGARTRLSTFLAGVFLLILVVALGDVVAPMAALVAVMIFVSITTFDWHSWSASSAQGRAWSESAGRPDARGPCGGRQRARRFGAAEHGPPCIGAGCRRGGPR